MRDTITYGNRVLYSINEARALLGGISQTTLYALLRTSELASVVIGCRRFNSKDSIAEFVKGVTTTMSPSRTTSRGTSSSAHFRSRYPLQSSSGHTLVDACDQRAISARPVLTAQPNASRRIGGWLPLPADLISPPRFAKLHVCAARPSVSPMRRYASLASLPE